MAILVADVSRTLGANPQLYLLDDEDTVNVSIANNNNGKGVTVIATFARATGSTDPRTVTIPAYAPLTLTGVRMKALLLSGSGANVTVIVTSGVEVIRVEPINIGQRPQVRNTFYALFRLAARPYALSNIFAGAGRKQFAVASGPVTNPSTIVKLRNCFVALESSSAAAIVMADLINCVNLPATGNPAIIARAVDRNDGDDTFLTTLCLPTTEAAQFDVFSTVEWNLGITGAASLVNPPPFLTWVDLVNPTGGVRGEQKDIVVSRPGTGQAEGVAVMIDVNAATTIKAYVLMILTEEPSP